MAEQTIEDNRSPLAKIFTIADAIKRRTKDFAKNPSGYAEQVADLWKQKLSSPDTATQAILDNMGGGTVGSTLIPAKALRGALGDVARQVQDYVSYVAHRGLPLSNEGLFFHEKVPFFVSPSSGKLMAINPAIEELYKLPKNIKDKKTIGEFVPEKFTELIPEVRKTTVEPAKNMEFLDMWSKNIAGKYRPPIADEEGRIVLQNKTVDAQTLLHEMMHDVQNRYGLTEAKPVSAYNLSAPGEMERYLGDWGEKEARSAEGVIRDMVDFRSPVSRLPRYARAPRINIEGTNVKEMAPGSEEEAVLQSLMRGSKENPFTFAKGGLVQMKESTCR